MAGSLEDAHRVFDEMSEQNAVSWTVMIAAYSRRGFGRMALALFEQKVKAGLQPNQFTFASVLPACADLAAMESGKEVHEEISRRRFQSNVFVGSALVDMYVKCGSLKDARQVFDKMPERNVVSWTAMVAGYAHSGDVYWASVLFQRMPERIVVSWNAMMVGYSQDGRVHEAMVFLLQMPDSEVVSWTAMIAGCAQNGHGEEVLTLFSQMRQMGVKPNQYTFACVLPACASLASLEYGSKVHEEVIRHGFESNVFVNKSKPVQKIPEQERLHIFIRTLTGKTICKKIWTGILIKNLKEEIQADTGIPPNLLCLAHEGKMLQDNYTLQHYGIGRDSTISLSTRLRGGSADAGPKGFQGSSSKSTGSYRDAAKGKSSSKGKEPAAFNPPPGQYIVDQTPETPSISLDFPEVKGIHSDLENKAVICRFNGFWPKTEALYQWIHTVWTKDCQIHLCSKGFFIITFLEIEERDKILNEGPWFWGNAGLFVTPWFSDFDANTMVVSRMPVWVRLHNLPLHFWHFKSLTAIGNSLGRMLKIDTDRHLKGIFTFARICVEVDLSKGLPESIFLTFNNIQWKQPLDYENTAFRCRGCQQTGHLLKACPSKSKPQLRKSRGWQNLNEVLERRTAKKKAPSGTEEAETEAEEDDTTIEEVEIENQKEDSAVNKDSLPHSNQVETQQDKAETANGDQNIGGNKRQHLSDSSDSDKESRKLKESSQLIIISSEPPLGEWRKVEKKKGRKT